MFSFMVQQVELFDVFIVWDKVFSNGPSKLCGRQPLKNLKSYDLPKWSTLEYFDPFYLFKVFIIEITF